MMYKYRFSTTVKDCDVKKQLAEEAKSLGVMRSEANDTVTVEGEAQFEACMEHLSRFSALSEHEFCLFRKG